MCVSHIHANADLKEQSALLQLSSYFHSFGHNFYPLWQHCALQSTCQDLETRQWSLRGPEYPNWAMMWQWVVKPKMSTIINLYCTGKLQYCKYRTLPSKTYILEQMWLLPGLYSLVTVFPVQEVLQSWTLGGWHTLPRTTSLEIRVQGFGQLNDLG